jgi:hypothetical protein
MTPKEKAQELIQEHWFRIDEYIQPKTWLEKELLIKLTEKAAKDCALLTVDELIEATSIKYEYNSDFEIRVTGKKPLQYWLDVKNEIEAL